MDFSIPLILLHRDMDDIKQFVVNWASQHETLPSSETRTVRLFNGLVGSMVLVSSILKTIAV